MAAKGRSEKNGFHSWEEGGREKPVYRPLSTDDVVGEVLGKPQKRKGRSSNNIEGKEEQACRATDIQRLQIKAFRDTNGGLRVSKGKRKPLPPRRSTRPKDPLPGMGKQGKPIMISTNLGHLWTK